MISAASSRVRPEPPTSSRTQMPPKPSAAALRSVFRHSWKGLPVCCIKGAVGHAMAAAGALEAIVAVRSCADGVVPPTVNLEEPDRDCQLDHVIGRPRHTEVGTVLSASFGMGGQNAAIIFKKAT